MVSAGRTTELLLDWSEGNAEALKSLMPLVYDELRRLARNYLRRERLSHTLDSAALVHEAYLRLVDLRRVRWQNRAHFFGIAAQLMRRILVDHARKRHAAKRGAGEARLSLDPPLAWSTPPQMDLIALDDALNRLALLDAQQSKIVELRFFGGLSVEDASQVLGISPATVKRDWAMAKAWLHKELNG
jgi:RNA polymerase sigma factor (TIGR02999 family)